MPIITLREGRDNLDIRMSLFCSPASLTKSFSPRGSLLLFSALSLRFLAHEARQRDRFWKNTCGEVVKAGNENIP